MTNKDLKMSGNKGEWSELYAFMKLLSQGRVYAANEKVEKIEDVYYPILKIMREETRGEIIDYIIGDNQINVEMHSNRILSIDRKEMGNQADRLLSEIATHSGSFELEDVAKFANGIKVTKIKAPSTDTTDISMQIEDIHTNYIRNVGFSIKSEIGNAPTLLNAGLTTNFIYKVTGISSAQANEINAIDTRTKIKDKMSKIAKYFDVSVDYLLGKTDIKKDPTVTVYDEHDNIVRLDDETIQLLDSLRTRPDMKMLFSISSKATPEDVLKAVKIIEALRDESEGK